MRTTSNGGYRWLLALLVLLLVVAACADDEDTADAEDEADETEDEADETEDTDAAADDPDDGEFDWRRYDGETIRVVANQHPWQEAIEPLVGGFEELTGITVEVETLPEEQFRQRLQVELTAGSSDIDVFMSSVQNEGARFSQSGWYEDLWQYVENESLVSPDYDFADLGDGVIEGHDYGGTLVGIPIQLETQMLMYNTRIFEEHGVDVPQTLDELEEVAAQIDDPDGVRAFGARGRTAAAVTQISTYLFNHGADWTDDAGNAAFATPEGAEAFDFYGRLLREYGPSGAVNASWEEMLPLFQQGEIAMYTDASAFLPQILDESASQVADEVGFAPMPSGPGGEFQTFFGWAISMSSLSEAKEPAWYFIQWATSPEITEALQAEGVPGARESVPFGDEFPEDFVQAFQDSLPVARPQLPQVIPVPEVRDAIGAAVVQSIQGGDVEAAVERAATDFDRIVGSQ